MSPFKQDGVVLLTTVMMIALIALLVLSQMQMVFLNYRLLNQVVEKHQSFFQLEEEANRLALGENFSSSCVIKEQDPNELILLLKNKKGCTLTYKQQQFYYLVEELGLFPCLQTQLNQAKYSTEHRRITLLSADKYSAILQLRMAKLAKLAACENNKSRQIKIGLVSWRYMAL